MTTDAQRLTKLLQYLNIRPVELAKQIGLSRPSILYHILNNTKYGISKELAQMICQQYPNISPGWLCFGDGPMLKEPKQEPVPYSKQDVEELIDAVKSLVIELQKVM